MSDFPATAASSFLSVLRTLPVWLLFGLALVGYAILFAPAFGGIDPTNFRAQWGVWAWIEAIAFSILAVVRGVDASVRTYLSRRHAVDGRALRLVARHQQCWWHLARQQDESFISQISLKLEVANLTDRPVRIVKATLIRPRIKGSLLQSDVMLPRAGSPYHSDRHPIPSHDTVTASVHLMARGALASQGKSIHATIGITDQFGDEYRLKGISIPSHDKALPKPPMTTRLLSSLRRLPGLRPTIETDAAVLPPLAEWLHGGKFEAADLILNDERRNYAANGRERGGLGSLNVTLQSEPNFGWTEVGKVPSLLWDKAQAKTIESSNIERLLKLVALDAAGKESLEQYLLSHLNKASPFADVGYFIFLALHRMDRTVNALRAARSNLAGDKVFGYSNLLGTLSALISHEHFDINPDLYPQILDALGGDTESNFRLAEKINLARIQQLDLRPEA